MDKIILTIPAFETRAVIELLGDEAPRTCQAIWQALPLEYPAFHGRRSGKEVFILVDPLEMTEPENSTVDCRGGEVFLLYLPPTLYVGEHQDYRRTSQGMFDIAFIYGEDALLRAPFEVLPGNLFGRFVEGLADFAAASERLWMEGSQAIRLDRESEE